MVRIRFVPAAHSPLPVHILCRDPERRRKIEATLRALGPVLPLDLPAAGPVTLCAVHAPQELPLLLGPHIDVPPVAVLHDLTGLTPPWIAAVLGMMGYIHWRSDDEDQAYCLQQVAGGYPCALPPADGEFHRSRRHGHLTPDQRRTLALIARGTTHDDICEMLDIPAGTFRHHLDAVRRVLGLKPGADLTAAASRCGFRGPNVRAPAA